MSERVKTTKLPTANGNMPLTDEEKADVINDATFAYEKFLDALRIIGVRILIVIIHLDALQKLM